MNAFIFEDLESHILKAICPCLIGANLSKPVYDYMQEALIQFIGARRRLACLTDLQLRVLQGHANGKNTQEIARALHKSRRTVQGQRQAIFDRLQIGSLQEAIVLFWQSYPAD